MAVNDLSFYDIINRNAVCFKEREAWFDINGNRTLTFSEYKEKVDRLAAGLQKLGVKKGDRIAIIDKNSLEYFLLYGAAAALGAIILPINWRLSFEEVCLNLNECEPLVVFADQEYQEMVYQLQDKLSYVVKRYLHMMVLYSFTQRHFQVEPKVPY